MIYLTFLLLLFLGVLWILICNEVTLKQRMKIIDQVYNTDTPREVYNKMSSAFQRVDYNQHLWALVTFQDYKKLYGSIFEETK